MDETKVSYTRLVFRLAWANTWALIKDRTVDAVVVALSAPIGGVGFGLIYGWAEMTKEIVTVIAFAVLPAGLFFIFAFLWNLCLASDELVYEAIKSIQRPSGEAPSPASTKAVPTPINWDVWRQVPRYKIQELAAILARTDPSSNRTNHEQAAFQRLILEEVAANKLEYVKEYGVGLDGRRYLSEVNLSSFILRENAIAWAKTKRFDVSHIE